MKGEILLIQPWIHDFAAYDFWANPLGLLMLAAIIRENGLKVRVIDCLDSFHRGLAGEEGISLPRKRGCGHGKFPCQVIPKPAPLRDVPRVYHRYGITPRLFQEALLAGPEPDVVLVTSMMTYWYPGVFEAVRMVKETWPDVPVVLGGNYATLCPGHAKLSGADLVVPGYGEEALAPIFKEMLGAELSHLPAVADLDSYPYPAYDLVPQKDQVSVLTSRGCPYRCTYCASHLLHRRFVRRDPVKVAAEIAYWHRRLGIRDFSFYDDALFVEPQSLALPLLEEICRLGLACRFHCPNGLHLREIDRELAVLMRKAGFATIRFGFETADEKRQVSTGGKTDNEALRQAVFHLKTAGYETQEIGVYILCGLPGQKAAEVERSILFVRSCGARPIIAEYSPIPGTPLWEEAGQTSPFPLAEEPLFHNNTLLPCQGPDLTYEDYRRLKLLARG